MSSKIFTKENLDLYLKELAKEYKKLGGKLAPAEIVLVGGAAILANYGFRNMTTDIDAIIYAESIMKEAINTVGDKFSLPNNWLNSDFKHTSSYSTKLDEVSVHYKSFYGVLTVRTISDESLIAMKLKSARKYKNDLSDIIGILVDLKKEGKTTDLEKIKFAVEKLYDDWNIISEEARNFITDAITSDNLDEIYASIKREENLSREILINFEEDYKNVVTQSNVNEILTSLKNRK